MHVRRKRLASGKLSPYWTIEVVDRNGKKTVAPRANVEDRGEEHRA